MPVSNVTQLIAESHAIAVDRGWWNTGVAGRSVLSQTNNFRGEIAEAWEEYRHNRMDLWWSCKQSPGIPVELHPQCDSTSAATGRTLRCFRIPAAGSQLQWEHEDNDQMLKSEGFWTEIGDLCIRVADTMGAYGWNYDNQCFIMDDLEQLIDQLYGLVQITTSYTRSDDKLRPITRWHPEAGEICSEIINACVDTAKKHGVNLWELIDLKMTYNRTRPYRHGNLKA